MAAESDQRISALTRDEAAWIDQLLDDLEAAGVPLAFPALSDAFDEGRAAWAAVEDGSRPDPNPMINAVGAGFGAVFVRELGLRWAVVTDEHGSDMAVVGEPNEIVLFPMSLVAKRWTAGPRALDGLGEAVVRQVRDIRAGRGF